MTNPDSPAIGILNGRELKNGVEIDKVLTGGPCDKVGLRGGDVITKLNGKPVRTFEQLVGSIMKYDSGDIINLTTKRGNETRVVNVVLGRREELQGTYK